MDPNFSVLLNYEGEDKCATEVKDNDGITAALIGGIIGGIAGITFLALLIGLVIYPRVRTWMQTRKHKQEMREMNELETVGSDKPLVIERMSDMSVTTASGTFTVKM